MSHPLTDFRQGKPSVTVSIPPEKREAFYRALVALRQHYGDPFSSMSSLIVTAIVEAGEVAAQSQPNQRAHPLS